MNFRKVDMEEMSFNNDRWLPHLQKNSYFYTKYILDMYHT